MSEEISCPGCGEQDELRGERTDASDARVPTSRTATRENPASGRRSEQTGTAEIRITCETCGAEWIRGTDPTCATCGGTDIVFRPRAMTQYSRGTQMSLVGWQNVPMCARCDAEALERSTASAGPVPARYEPAAMKPRTT